MEATAQESLKATTTTAQAFWYEVWGSPNFPYKRTLEVGEVTTVQKKAADYQQKYSWGIWPREIPALSL